LLVKAVVEERTMAYVSDMIGEGGAALDDLRDRLIAENPDKTPDQIDEMFVAEIIRATRAGDRSYTRALAEFLFGKAEEGDPEALEFFRSLRVKH